MTVRLLVSGSREWANARRLIERAGLDEVAAASMAKAMRAETQAVLLSAVRTLAAARPGEPIVLVHGGASGADIAAGWEWARVRGAIRRELGAASPALLDPEVHVPAWGTRGTPEYNPNAGFERNAAMIAMGADLVVGFMVDRSGGCEHLLSLAVHARITTWMTRSVKCAAPVRSLVTAGNILATFPPFPGMRTRWQMLTAGEPVEAPLEVVVPPLVHAAADWDSRCMTMLADGDICVEPKGHASHEDDMPPMCRSCGAEAQHGHAVGCVMADFTWTAAPVFHDRTLGEDRCGECGATVAAHTMRCYVQKRPVQRKAEASA